MEFIFNVFGFNDAQRHYQTIYHTEEIYPHHRASFTHEAIAGAVGFAAMHAYESHLRATGRRPSHSLMKEILAGIAAAEVDKLVETKGLDWIDRHRAKQMAIRQAHELAYTRYEGGTGWEYAQGRGGYAVEYDYESRLPFGARGHPWYDSYTSVEYVQEGGYYPPPATREYEQTTYYEEDRGRGYGGGYEEDTTTRTRTYEERGYGGGYEEDRTTTTTTTTYDERGYGRGGYEEEMTTTTTTYEEDRGYGGYGEEMRTTTTTTEWREDDY